MERRSLSLIPLMTVALCAPIAAVWNFSADADLRTHLTEGHAFEAEVHAAGFSVRKTFSDQRADRLILFGLVEAQHTFGEIMLHELYARYKGPLGGWNITVGRFGLPYGLLPTFSASRLLFSGVSDIVLGFDADNGLMVSGMRGSFEYALALTQGYGPHHLPSFPGHGLVTGRIGLTIGDTDENSIGLSAVGGTAASEHHRDHTQQRFLGGIDATVYWGQVIGRIEINGGYVDRTALAVGWAAVDYALLAWLDVNAALTLSRSRATFTDAWFAGVTFKPRWLTLRGGYTYAHFAQPHHRFSLQAYRLFSVTL